MNVIFYLKDLPLSWTVACFVDSNPRLYLSLGFTTFHLSWTVMFFIVNHPWSSPSFVFKGVAVYPRSLRAYRKKRTDCLKIKRNCIETLDFSISSHIIKLQSYTNAFTCIWYVWNTYHSPVTFHVNSTYFIRSTPVY